jgi:hypothetical protein
VAAALCTVNGNTRLLVTLKTTGRVVCGGDLAKRHKAVTTHCLHGVIQRLWAKRLAKKAGTWMHFRAMIFVFALTAAI